MLIHNRVATIVVATLLVCSHECIYNINSIFLLFSQPKVCFSHIFILNLHRKGWCRFKVYSILPKMVVKFLDKALYNSLHLIMAAFLVNVRKEEVGEVWN